MNKRIAYLDPNIARPPQGGVHFGVYYQDIQLFVMERYQGLGNLLSKMIKGRIPIPTEILASHSEYAVGYFLKPGNLKFGDPRIDKIPTEYRCECMWLKHPRYCRCK